MYMAQDKKNQIWIDIWTGGQVRNVTKQHPLMQSLSEYNLTSYILAAHFELPFLSGMGHF